MEEREKVEGNMRLRTDQNALARQDPKLGNEETPTERKRKRNSLLERGTPSIGAGNKEAALCYLYSDRTRPKEESSVSDPES